MLSWRNLLSTGTRVGYVGRVPKELLHERHVFCAPPDIVLFGGAFLSKNYGFIGV
jgi:hypothetical protein